MRKRIVFLFITKSWDKKNVCKNLFFLPFIRTFAHEISYALNQRLKSERVHSRLRLTIAYAETEGAKPQGGRVGQRGFRHRKGVYKRFVRDVSESRKFNDCSQEHSNGRCSGM